jgi:hypothetical protein
MTPEHAALVASIAAGFGLLIPFIQAIIQRPSWSPRVKSWITVGLAIIGGVLGYLSQNGLDFSSPEKIILWVLGVYTAATTFYARLLKPNNLEKVEEAVNGDPEIEVPPEDLEVGGDGEGPPVG